MSNNDYIIRSEFEQYKTETNRRLDEIKEMLKPQFTKGQITSFLLSFVVVMASVFIWVGSLKSDIDKFNDHIKDEIVHMPLDKKIKTFVLKDNYDSNVKEMKSDIKEIKTDIKAILKAQ